MFRWRSRTVVQALVDGGECALVYGATANVLAFAVPLVHRPTDATLAFAVLSQLLTLLPALVLSGLIAGAQFLCPTRWTAGIAPGPASLTAIALVTGVALRQPTLVAVSFAVAGVLLLIGSTPRYEPRARADRRLNWTTGVLLALTPFLAQARPGDSWPAAIAAGSAIAVFIVAMAWLQADRLRPAASNWTPVWRWNLGLAALILLGLTPGWLAYQAEPSLRIAGGRESRASTGANVILITLDTVRADHLSAYGYRRPTTPALEDFVERGAVRYTHAFSTSDMTLSSHASMFTGLLPSDHGAHRHGAAPDSGMRAHVDTLAGRLHEAGFTTVGLASNAAYLTQRFGFATGFDYYDVRRPMRFTAPFPDYFVGGRFVEWLLASVGPESQLSYRPAADIMLQASRLLRPLKDDGRPFLLFLNLMDAHAPMIPPAPYRRAFGVSDRGFYWLTEYERLADGVNAGTRRITDAEYDNLVASYDAGIASMDAELGRFFTELKRLDLFDRSLIIVTSDHGELFGRSGALGHDGIGVTPGLLRVPLLVKYPAGVVAPSDTNRPVSGIDLYPTILALCGIPSPGGEGQSLLTPISLDRPVFFESFESAWLTALHPRFRGDERAALVGDRLIATNSRAEMPNRWTAADVRQVSSSASDAPDRNLDHAYAVLRRLEAEGAAESRRPTPSRVVLDRLRSVGYIRQ